MPIIVLGPGDKIRVTVFGETDLSGEYHGGWFGHGAPAADRPGARRRLYRAAQLEQAIAGALAQGYLKIAARQWSRSSTYRPFYIIGAVNRPGQYPYVEQYECDERRGAGRRLHRPRRWKA